MEINESNTVCVDLTIKFIHSFTFALFCACMCLSVCISACRLLCVAVRVTLSEQRAKIAPPDGGYDGQVITLSDFITSLRYSQPAGRLPPAHNASFGCVNFLCFATDPRATESLYASVWLVAFSSRARIWGECWTIHFPPALFFFFFFFFLFKWRVARINQLHPSGQYQSTVAQRAETTVTECFLTSCV